MLEPFTVSVGLASFLGGTISHVPGHLAASTVEKIGKLITGEALVRSAGHFGVATNHDAEKAVRRAQMASLKCLLNEYYSCISYEDEAAQFPLVFIEAAFHFADAPSASLRDGSMINGDAVREAMASLNAALGRVASERLSDRANALRTAASEVFFSELVAQVEKQTDKRRHRRIAVPGGFRQLFFYGRAADGTQTEIVNWYDGFILFTMRELKSHDSKFRAIFEATRLASAAEIALDNHEVALLTQATVADMAKILERNEGRIDRLLNVLAGSVEILRRIADRLQVMERKFEQVREAVERLVETLSKNQELSAKLERADINLQKVLALARRTAQNVYGFDEAMKELEERVSVAIEVSQDTQRNTNLGAFVDAVLTRVRVKYDANDFDAASEEATRGFTEWRLQEAERRQGALEAGIKILDTGLKQDILRRDASSVAERIALTNELKHPEDSEARVAALGEEFDRWFESGRDKGLNFDLEVAIEIARRSIRKGLELNGKFRWHLLLGNALWTLGEREGAIERLQDAITAYRSSLKELSREEDPLDWAMAQNNLGIGLRSLGQRESDSKYLEEAAAVFKLALEERKRQRVPREWGRTQNNLGAALFLLGEREGGTERLEDAISTLSLALEELTRERDPTVWADALHDLGNAVQALGEREGGTERLTAAIDMYQLALEALPREHFPMDWAVTHLSLGNTLRILGERESGTNSFEQAIAAYSAALAELTRDRAPLRWAVAQGNLSIALRRLGERTCGTELLLKSIAGHREALEELTRDRAPLERALAQSSMGNALRALGERQAEPALLEQSVTAHRAALQVLTRQEVPLRWAEAQNNLGRTLRALGERSGGASHLEEAIEVLRLALEERTRERLPLDWATTATDLSVALRALGERMDDLALLEEAVELCHSALEELTRDRAPLDWATAQHSLGSALSALGDENKIEHAIGTFQSALEERTRGRLPFDWGVTQVDLSIALRRLGLRRSMVEHLETAVRMCRTALEELTRDCVPFEWARAQRHLALALCALAERQVGLQYLPEAVAAFRAALEEITDKRCPDLSGMIETELKLSLALSNGQENA
jgi:tetratricopeptide (TPR) repeat protein